MDANWDTHILFELNSLIPNNPLGMRIVSFLANNMLFREFPILFPLVALWFSQNSMMRRSRILIGLVFTCFATLVSVWAQNHIPFHTRPFLDPSLHLHLVDPKYAEGWDHLGSFPSDTGTLFFGLATIIFIENRIVGVIAYLWTVVAICMIHAAVGWHYPSDFAGAIVLGPGMVYIGSRIRSLEAIVERGLTRYETYLYLVHALFFIFLADAYSLFLGLRGFLSGALIIVGYLIKH